MPFLIRRFPVTADHVEDIWTTGTIAERETCYDIRHTKLVKKRRFIHPFTIKDDVRDDALDPDLIHAMAASRVDYRGREE